MKQKQKQLWDDGFYSTKERSEKISNFMKNHNPMKNPEIAKKNADKRRGVKRPQSSGEKNPAFKGVFHTECLNCGLDIAGPKWEIKNRKFCSVNCRHEYYNGYVKKLNLVIEIDENHHFTKDGNYVEDDIKRQNLIENELNCKFLRIKDCEKNCISLNELKKELKNIYK